MFCVYRLVVGGCCVNWFFVVITTGSVVLDVVMFVPLTPSFST